MTAAGPTGDDRQSLTCFIFRFLKRPQLKVSGDPRGVWDGRRVQQLVGNLVLNAIKYGAQDTQVRVTVTGDVTHVHIDVSNRGPAIDSTLLACIFDPLTRGANPNCKHDSVDSLGLGLYIASEIAKAHHGVIEARSDETETTFSVTLPRSNEP